MKLDFLGATEEVTGSKFLLTTKDGFTMEGLNASFTLQVAHLRPAISPQMQVLELQRQFVGMQWERPDDEE